MSKVHLPNPEPVVTKRGAETLSEWMTTTEASAYLKTKPRTLLKWVREGSIKAWPLHGTRRRTWRFRREHLDAALGLFALPMPCGVVDSSTSSVVRVQLGGLQ